MFLQSLIHTLAKTVNHFSRVFPMDAYIIVCDMDGTVLGFSPTRFLPLSLNVGEKVPPGNLVEEVLRSGRCETARMPAGPSGVEVSAMGMPVFDNDVMVGVVTVGVSKMDHLDLYVAAKAMIETSGR